LLIVSKLRSNPNSIAEVDNLLEVQTVTARFESHHNDRLEGTIVHACIQISKIERDDELNLNNPIPMIRELKARDIFRLPSS
jgi:hypothetical protein